MSDGPHRSLPMRPRWKTLAERASKGAYATQEVADAFSVALKRDFQEAPLSDVRSILGAGEQGALFSDDCAAQLDAARRGCRGSAAGNTLIDCAIEASANGMSGDAAFHSALENALDAHARAGCHQIEEHWQREEPRNASSIRDRLTTARGHWSASDLASELISGTKTGGGSTSLPKRTGVDEGPAL